MSPERSKFLRQEARWSGCVQRVQAHPQVSNAEQIKVGLFAHTTRSTEILTPYDLSHRNQFSFFNFYANTYCQNSIAATAFFGDCDCFLWWLRLRAAIVELFHRHTII